MTQLLLDLEPPRIPTFDNFVVGRNGEAVAALRALGAAASAEGSARCLYLWGERGSGRSHLLRAAADAMGGAYVDGARTPPRPAAQREPPDDGASRRMLALDDVDACDADAQEALFHVDQRAARRSARIPRRRPATRAPRDLA